MHFTLALIFAAAAAALNIPRDADVDTTDYSTNKCGVKSTCACVCPNGTTFSNSTTFGWVGAPVDDIYNITGDYFSTNWFDLPVAKTKGPDNTVGTLRWLNVTASGSTYQLEEDLTTQQYVEGQSFAQSFHLVNTPLSVPQVQGGGLFGGYWVNIRVQQLTDDVSYMSWGVYRCVTGNPFDFTGFHEIYMTKISTLLQQAGKLRTNSSVPYSIGDR